jgi:hypothetical protein
VGDGRATEAEVLQDVPQICVGYTPRNKSCPAPVAKSRDVRPVDYRLGSGVSEDWWMEVPKLRNKGELALTKHSEDGPVAAIPSQCCAFPPLFIRFKGIFVFLQINSHVPMLSITTPWRHQML